ncbi:MAG: MotA/TolQ/ExbB proton channel family protein [Gemmatimonadota bacterium]
MATLALVGSLARLDVLRTGGPIVWGVIVAAALLAANTLRVAFRLWVRQDIRAAERRRAWRTQLGLVPTAVSFSALGATVAAYETAGQIAVHADWAGGLRFVRDVMVLLWGVLGAVLGFLGTTVGLSQAAGAFAEISNASPGPIWGGIRVALSTTIVGLCLLGIASIAWLTLQFLNGRKMLRTD